MAITAKPRGNVVNYYSGNTDRTIDRSDNKYWISLSITNDDNTNNLTITVNNMIITVKAGETFDEDFEDFDSVIIQTNVNYRIWLRE
jgi:hypothetical protein